MSQRFELEVTRKRSHLGTGEGRTVIEEGLVKGEEKLELILELGELTTLVACQDSTGLGTSNKGGPVNNTGGTHASPGAGMCEREEMRAENREHTSCQSPSR